MAWYKRRCGRRITIAVVVGNRIDVCHRDSDWDDFGNACSALFSLLLSGSYDLPGYTHYDGPRRNVLRDHRTSADNRIIANGNAVENDDTGTDPYISPDRDTNSLFALNSNGNIHAIDQVIRRNN